jgi:hypothetical protein
MDIRHWIGLAALAVGMASGAASAATVDDGTFTISASNPGAQLTSNVAGAVTFATSATFSGYSGSVVTPVATISGGALNPGGSTNPGAGPNYLATYSGNPETISFGSTQSYLGFLWGSVDPSNTVTFYNGATEIASYTGAQLNSSVGLAYYPNPASYVDFAADNAGSYFNKVVLSEAVTYFETNNYATVSAVPLPAALPMFGAALMGLGGLGLKKKRAKTIA